MSQQTKAANVFIPIQPKPNQFDHIQDSEKIIFNPVFYLYKNTLKCILFKILLSTM